MGKEHPLRSTWRSMIKRCENPSDRAWAYYGGRGIKVAAEWRSFEAFLAYVGERPVGLSLDRIDNDGNYEPGNVRWATKHEQMMNRRNAVYVEIEGFRYRVYELAKLSGHRPDTIKERAERGLSYAEVVNPERSFSYNREALVAAGLRSAAKRSQKTHCKHGHEFTPENTLQQRSGRLCRACFYIKEGKRRRRKAAEAKIA